MTEHRCADCMRFVEDTDSALEENAVGTCRLDGMMPYDPMRKNSCLKFMLD